MRRCNARILKYNGGGWQESIFFYIFFLQPDRAERNEIKGENTFRNNNVNIPASIGEWR